MGNFTFSDVKSYIEFNKTTAQGGYSFPMLPRYNKLVGNIKQSQVHIIAGMPASGVSSFIDQNYIVSVLLQWYNITPDERPPLKIFYYSMGASELKKLQLLLCNYLKLVNNIFVDVPTLNSQIGKLYDIDSDPNLPDAIEEASQFFDEVLNEGVLELKDGQKNPTDIYNDITEFVEDKGTITSTKQFEFDQDYENLTTMVVVDDTGYFSPDTDGFGTITGEAVDEKFKRYISELKTKYKITAIIAVPAKLGYVRSVKDTEPHYKHLGVYAKLADKGVCLYNPINEKNIKLYDADESKYVTDKGNNLLRTWHIIRNVDGIDSAYDRLLFLPGASFMVEYSTKNSIDDITEVLDVIEQETSFII